MDKSKNSTFNRVDLDREFFREAVQATALATGFNPTLIEKDYFCSLLLSNLFSMKNCPLVFKGGTALNKVFAGFYRLSEDLDFSIPLAIDSTRSQRSKTVAPAKDFIAGIPKEIPAMSFSTAFQGRNNSMQYIGELQYDSLVGTGSQTIKIEIGLREPLVTKAEMLMANSLLLDPLKKKPLIDGVMVKVLSKNEAYAEKIRAALSRREPAIRDFFDLAYALKNSHVTLEDERLLPIVRQKLSVPGNEMTDFSSEIISELRAQLETDLRPVLREDTYGDFSLETILEIMKEYRKNLSSEI